MSETKFDEKKIVESGKYHVGNMVDEHFKTLKLSYRSDNVIIREVSFNIYQFGESIGIVTFENQLLITYVHLLGLTVITFVETSRSPTLQKNVLMKYIF